MAQEVPFEQARTVRPMNGAERKRYPGTPRNAAGLGSVTKRECAALPTSGSVRAGSERISGRGQPAQTQVCFTPLYQDTDFMLRAVRRGANTRIELVEGVQVGGQ
jgi:hypothetical protein